MNLRRRTPTIRRWPLPRERLRAGILWWARLHIGWVVLVAAALTIVGMVLW